MSSINHDENKRTTHTIKNCKKKQYFFINFTFYKKCNKIILIKFRPYMLMNHKKNFNKMRVIIQ